MLDTTAFTVEHDRFGVLQRKELKPGGSKIYLTEENKKEYVKLYVNFRFMQVSKDSNGLVTRNSYQYLLSWSLLVMPLIRYTISGTRPRQDLRLNFA